METSPSTVIEFQHRRLRTWKVVRLWFFVLVLGVIGFETTFYLERDHVKTEHHAGLLLAKTKATIATEDMTVGTFTLGFVSFVLIIVAIIVISTYVNRYYRCPSCESVPLSRILFLGASLDCRYLVDTNPSVCQKCGARLR